MLVVLGRFVPSGDIVWILANSAAVNSLAASSPPHAAIVAATTATPAHVLICTRSRLMLPPHSLVSSQTYTRAWRAPRPFITVHSPPELRAQGPPMPPSSLKSSIP